MLFWLFRSCSQVLFRSCSDGICAGEAANGFVLFRVVPILFSLARMRHAYTPCTHSEAVYVHGCVAGHDALAGCSVSAARVS